VVLKGRADGVASGEVADGRSPLRGRRRLRALDLDGWMLFPEAVRARSTTKSAGGDRTSGTHADPRDVSGGEVAAAVAAAVGVVVASDTSFTRDCDCGAVGEFRPRSGKEDCVAPLPLRRRVRPLRVPSRLDPGVPGSLVFPSAPPSLFSPSRPFNPLCVTAAVTAGPATVAEPSIVADDALGAGACAGGTGGCAWFSAGWLVAGSVGQLSDPVPRAALSATIGQSGIKCPLGRTLDCLMSKSTVALALVAGCGPGTVLAVAVAGLGLVTGVAVAVSVAGLGLGLGTEVAVVLVIAAVLDGVGGASAWPAAAAVAGAGVGGLLAVAGDRARFGATHAGPDGGG
jgi:hypothetical protein